MDDRFPKWLKVVVRRFDFLGIPNLSTLIIGLSILGYIGMNFMNMPLGYFIFDPQSLKQGEWWRIFAFPVSQSLDNPFWFLFYILYIHFVVGALQEQWGAGPLTFFTLLSYICAVVGALLTNQITFIWFYVLQNISLAFGTIYPNLQLYLFFVIPVKAKWLTIFAGALLLIQFLFGSMKIFLLIAMFPYLLFFSPYLFKELRTYIKVRQNRNRLK